MTLHSVGVGSSTHATMLGGRTYRSFPKHESLSQHNLIFHSLRNLCWIIGRKSQLSLENKLLVCKVILKPVWTYGIQLWGTASNSYLEILERLQSKALRVITDTPRYVPNTIIKRDVQIPTVEQEARKYGANCRKQLDADPNNLSKTLFNLLAPELFFLILAHPVYKM